MNSFTNAADGSPKAWVKIMKRLVGLTALALLLSIGLAGCSNQVIRVPIDPFVTSDYASRHIQRVAVLPVVVPDYLLGQSGETISVDLTNQFMVELANRRLYSLVGGDMVRDILVEQYNSPRNWLETGDVAGAIRLGRELKVEGVIFGRIVRYVQSNLTQSEVEVEFQLVEISSLETVWSVREQMLGKGGSPTFSDTVTTPTNRRLSQSAITGAAERIGEIHKAGGPIEVSNISTRRIAGYSLLSVGTVAAVTAGYYFTMSLNAYKDYQKADSATDLNRYQNDTEEYDRMWMIFGGVGAACLGTGVYLLLTDPSRQFTASNQNNDKMQVAVWPAVTPDAYLLGLSGRFE